MMDLTMDYDSWMAMRDSRVENWPLLQSPVPSLCLSAGYVCVCVTIAVVQTSTVFQTPPLQ
jgi:hypothetical protein